METHCLGPKSFKRVCIIVIAGLFYLGNSCHKKSAHEDIQTLHLSGPALGTIYNIKIQYLNPKKMDSDRIQSIVQNQINNINATFSNWDKESEISRLNRQPENLGIPLSSDFLKVFKKSQQIYILSGFRFDPAQSGLFDLWGFGTNNQYQDKHIRTQDSIPQNKSIIEIRKLSGMSQYKLNGNKIFKKNSSVRLNFSGIAKGYLVDKLFNEIYKIHKTVMVEVGGEVRVGDFITMRNSNKLSEDDSHWRIAIEKPEYHNQRKLFKVALLKNKAMASSGDYRNYFYISGDATKRRYSHIIDPLTGYPVSNQIESVTIIGPQCMVADALATTLMIMNVSDGLKMMQKFPGYEALIIYQTNASDTEIFSEKQTPGMSKYLQEI